MTVTVRPRRPDDVPVVAQMILRQQSVTRYPVRDPLPFPMEQFVVRRGELAAWVAELSPPSHDEEPVVVGHVSVLDLTDDPRGPEWVALTGSPVEELAEVSVLVVALDHGRRGVAGGLMDACETHLRAIGRTPVLEVLAGAHSPAFALYLSRGWQVVGEAERPWLPEGEGPVRLMTLSDPPAQAEMSRGADRRGIPPRPNR